jgi:hypothetical protein
MLELLDSGKMQIDFRPTDRRPGQSLNHRCQSSKEVSRKSKHPRHGYFEHKHLHQSIMQLLFEFDMKRHHDEMLFVIHK